MDNYFCRNNIDARKMENTLLGCAQKQAHFSSCIAGFHPSPKSGTRGEANVSHASQRSRSYVEVDQDTNLYVCLIDTDEDGEDCHHERKISLGERVFEQHCIRTAWKKVCLNLLSALFRS